VVNKKYYLWASVAAIAIILIWLNRREKTPIEEISEVVETPQNLQFYEPYYYTNAGIFDSPANLNGATSPFQSQIDVYLSNPVIGELTNKYIPMFGFVGVTAVGAQ